mgnify:CR=1 FL=1
MFEDKPIADVHIINKNTNIGTITNHNGVFEIPLKINEIDIEDLKPNLWEIPVCYGNEFGVDLDDFETAGIGSASLRFLGGCRRASR